MKNITDLLGRILLSFIFLYEAYDSIFFFKETKAKMDFYGLKWQPDFLLYGAIVLLVLGGLMILSGYRSSLGAFLLLLYWVPVTFIVHDFWNVPFECKMTVSCPQLQMEGSEVFRRMQGVMFMKNLAIVGGLLMVLVNGSGRFSVKRLFATTKVAGA
ncbi:MAG: DoxX family membrane protein [Bacteroidetes bacterium]|nr:DoxX family membrane protein [Bacteroidota bacterium]